ncbi:cytochrome P450 monooxygenase pc-1 [Coprinopsis sp. MPI-PUGE-AT-0042]|nr:cytochrome P450 monooxygenase pc-1 [Coprinopsis sp. MPI-PUGE-AT-0042]
MAFNGWINQKEVGNAVAPLFCLDCDEDQLEYSLSCWKCGYIILSPDLFLVVIIWPEYVKVNSNQYVEGERFQYAMSAVLDSGVFNSDREIWKLQCPITRPIFSRGHVTDLDQFERHTQTALFLLVEKAKTDYAMDMQDVFILRPFRIPRRDPGASAFSNAKFVIADRERHGHPWPLLEIFEARVEPHMEVVNRFVDPIIQVALRKNAANPKCAESNEIEADETLLDHLVRSTSDHKLLRDETLNILLAGCDTSSAVLTSTSDTLAMHPEVLKKLREEILTQLGPSRAPTYDDVRAMKYLRAVLNESMRLLPPVPNDVRECVNGAIWPSPDPDEKPIYIPPGSSTPYSPILIHTRKDLWGPDADEFDPDRFIDDRVKKYLVPNPYIFIPFNAGPGICLGQQFAYNLMSFVLVRLLQQFSSFSLDEEALTPELRVPKEWAETGKNSRKAKERFRPHTVLTMSSKGGIWLKATLADA